MPVQTRLAPSPIPRAPLAAVLAVMVLAAVACGGSGQQGAQGPSSASQSLPDSCRPTAQAAFQLPSDKGINYGSPTSVSGDWLGTSWLQPDTWPTARPRFQADLDFISQHGLGQELRLFVGIDQLMVWDRSRGFVRFDEASLRDLSQALDMVDAHHLRVIAVVFDQEVRAEPGNFHFEALDGSHPEMRAGYLRAVSTFMRRFGSRSTVAGWDLFNEAYGSLGKEGGLPTPGPHTNDPVSPNYPDQTVRGWILDLYRTAKCAAPNAWYTVSDTTDLYWRNPPNTAPYAGALDFYDVHVYDDHPVSRDWSRLGKPTILGEVGGVPGEGLENQAVNAGVVGFLLSQASQHGAAAVLAQADGGEGVYSLSGGLTRTGQVLAAAQ